MLFQEIWAYVHHRRIQVNRAYRWDQVAAQGCCSGMPAAPMLQGIKPKRASECCSAFACSTEARMHRRMMGCHYTYKAGHCKPICRSL